MCAMRADDGQRRLTFEMSVARFPSARHVSESRPYCFNMDRNSSGTGMG